MKKKAVAKNSVVKKEIAKKPVSLKAKRQVSLFVEDKLFKKINKLQKEWKMKSKSEVVRKCIEGV